MSYKLFVFDVDGTLTDMKDWKVVKSAADAIKQLQEKGYWVAIGSGRAAYAMPSVVEAGITPDYYISANGHVVCDRDLKTLWSLRIDRQLYNEINDFCTEHNLGFFWKFESGCYMHVDHPNMEKIYGGCAKCYYHDNPDENELPNAGALVSGPEGRKIFWERFKGRVEVVDGGLLLYDVNQLNVSKVTGLRVLMDKLGVSREEVMAFGDSENDLEMLREAGKAVVMGSGMECALKVADYITDAPENDGIINALKHFEIL